MFSKKERSSFKYWFAHKCAFNMTALNCDAWRFKYLFHDMEKPFMKLFLEYKTVQTLHRKYNKHHPEWLENHLWAYDDCDKLTQEKINKFLKRFDYKAAIIDWECSHFTKEACKLDAADEYRRLTSYENFSKKYPCITKYCYEEFKEGLEKALVELNLWHK